MSELPVQLQLLNNFIQERPDIVLNLLKKNGVKVPSKPTLNVLSRLSFQAVFDDNLKFVEDVDSAIRNEGESNFDPITLGVSAVLSIGSMIFGGRQAKKQRKLMANLKLAELSNAEKLAMAQINANATNTQIEIYTNSLLDYNKALQSESTIRQRDTGLFVGIMAVGLAIMYATVQIFKKN
mgnify:CR=1 FL=1|tara:strand:+ start:686 stop:1228 length:543 start_codon:yes stop_codon:yes gene_type:complete